MERAAGSTSSIDLSAARAVRRVLLGRVVGAHGLAGWLRVRLFGASADCFERARTLWLARDENDPEAVAHALRGVAAGRPGECRVALQGVTDRAAADAARGLWLLARAQDLARAEPGEYYVYELVGCCVEDRAGRMLGSVRALCGTGASDMLVVEDAAGREHLVPVARALLLEVDVAARRIVIDALPGLFESDA